MYRKSVVFSVLIIFLCAIALFVRFSGDTPSRKAVDASVEFMNRANRSDRVIIEFTEGLMSGDTRSLVIENKRELVILNSVISEAVVIGEASKTKTTVPFASSEHWKLKFYQKGNKLSEADLYYGDILVFLDECEYAIKLRRDGKRELYMIVDFLREKARVGPLEKG